MAAGPDALTVLIVEDNDDLRTTMRMLVSFGYGHIVYEAADGARAIELALEHRPRLALIDLGLPDLHGNEVARRIRGMLGARIRLVALTGYDTAEDRRSTAEAGFDAHLIKPVDRVALTRIFSELQTSGGEGAND